MEPVPVVLAGAHGHGWWHLANLRRLTTSGLVRLAGVCDIKPPGDEQLYGLGAPEVSADLAELLTRTGAKITVITTPIHTHTELALTAASLGSHLLLEKPPAPSQAEFVRLVDGVEATGRACQIGFQSLGSAAVRAVRDMISDGVVGRVRGIGSAAAWVRAEQYFTRAPWAGHRTLDGHDVVDGVLTNPLAHAIATALYLDRSDHAEQVGDIELELFHAYPIESDDTSVLRLRTARSTVITLAATLCAEQADEPYLIVHGDRGRITLWYKQDRVLLESADGGEPVETYYPRTDLLENLVAHVRDGAELLVPPRATGAFMTVLEAVRTAPSPLPVPDPAWRTDPGDGTSGPRRVVDGIDALVAASAERLALFSELGATWLPLPPSAHHPQ